MFVGCGTISGRASAIGQNNDRFSFQLVSEHKFSYRATQFRASLQKFERAQRDRKANETEEKGHTTDANGG
jgi:hypothetical protein